jgi:nitroreductase
MSFLDLAKRRYSVRKYQEKPVEEDKLSKILEAGRVAPTAANKQPQRLLVVREKEGLAKLKKGANIFGAPLAIIVCGEKPAAWVRKYDGKNTLDIDASIVTAQLMLEATELGLGTLWVGHFDPVVIHDEFKLPEDVEPINILAIGYADGEAASPNRHATQRKPLEDIVFYESYR